jgi:hypothetical protein
VTGVWLPEIKKHRAEAAKLKRKIEKSGASKLESILVALAHHNREIRRLTSSRSKSK